MEKQIITGLTGAYCAGKNYVSRLFEERGLPCLDVDKLGYKVIEAEKKAILERFGEDILSPGGTIDRKALGAKVFGKPGELAALEAIVHPAANRLTLEWIESLGGRPCVVNAALLHRSSAFEKLSAVIIVEAPFLTRFFRARKRDRLPVFAILKRFWSQRKFSAQYSVKKTDIYRVENRTCLAFRRAAEEAKLESRIDEILSQMGIR